MACNSKHNNKSHLCCNRNSITERTCIEARKVFDACVQQRNANLNLDVDFPQSETLVSVTGIKSSGESTISNLQINSIPGNRNSRVRFTATTPLTVTGTNQAGTTIVGTSVASFDLDIILYVPKNSIITPQISATVGIAGIHNTVIDGNTVTTDACVSIVTRVTADVILVIPSGGYPTLPSCQEYTQDICSGAFNTPIFPL